MESMPVPWLSDRPRLLGKQGPMKHDRSYSQCLLQASKPQLQSPLKDSTEQRDDAHDYCLVLHSDVLQIQRVREHGMPSFQ